MLHDKAGGKQRIFIKAVQEGVAEHVGDLQFRAQHHREDKEDRHAFVFKQRKGVQPQHAAPALFLLLVRNGNVWQCQSEQHQHDRQRRANVQLHMAQLEAGEAHRPHRQNKADGAPDADWREVGNDVHARRFQAVVGDGVNQAQRWHIGQRVKQNNEEHRPRRGDFGGHK